MKLKTLFFALLFLCLSQSVFAVATITSFSPFSGAVGTVVTINGTNLSNPSAFTIGGRAALIITNSTSKIVAMVMPGAVTGSVTVTSGGVTTIATGNFTVTATAFPKTQDGGELSGINAKEKSYIGASVAISADGNTAVTGAPGDSLGRGAVWIFVRNGNLWTQQGNKLVDNTALVDANSGVSVAISADGNTVIAGGSYPNTNTTLGGAAVFIRTGVTWHQQAKLTVSSSNSLMGASVAISADGNTALIGAPKTNITYVYTRAGTTWSAGSILVGSGGIGAPGQGTSVAISADGKTAIVGGPGDNSRGAAWVFTRTGNVWVQQGSKLVDLANSIASWGKSVAISADGNTAVLGGPGFNGNKGAVLTFNRSGNTWTQQDALTGTGGAGAGLQGTSVAITADGNTIVEGAVYDNLDIRVGATWTFTRSGTAWTQQGNKLVGLYNNPPNQGYAVAISADGNTTMVGGPVENFSTGAVWVFTPKAAQTIRLAASNPVNYGTVNVDLLASATSGLPVTFSSSNTSVAIILNGKAHILNAGSTDIIATQAGDGTFNAAPPIQYTQVVNKIPLAVKVNDAYGISGFALPAFTLSYTGFINLDNNSAIATPPTVTTAATPSSAPGNYTLTASGGSTVNYTFSSYAPGTLTLVPLSAITTPFPVKAYGDADFYEFGVATPALTYTSTNLAVATIVSGKIHIIGVGTTSITVTSGVSSYSKTLTVVKAALRVTADDKVKKQGDVNPVLTITYNGFVNGDTQSSLTTQPTVSTTAITTSPVGFYAITVGGGASLKYAFSYIQGTLEIQPSSIGMATNNIFVYPNPATTLANVRYELPSASTVTINVYNKSGFLLSSYQTNVQASGLHESEIPTGKLSTGDYIIKITAKNYNKFGKLIVQ